jgi:uncharacterized membrane protein YdjX (TVP38/TMEM64 family)
MQTTGRARSIRHFAAGFIALALLAAIVLGPGPQSVWESIQANLDQWQSWAAAHPLAALIIFFLVYAFATSLPLPVVTVMSLLAGALFGRPLGTAVASLAYTAGVTTAFLTTRWLLHDRVRKHSGRWLGRVQRGIARDGAFYLLTLRLMPSIPFFLVNVLMALTPIRTRTYVATSWVGVLPITFLYAGVGLELGSLDSPAGLLSWPLIASLVALAVVPLGLRMLIRRSSAAWT